jgi:hypothetical protein
MFQSSRSLLFAIFGVRSKLRCDHDPINAKPLNLSISYQFQTVDPVMIFQAFVNAEIALPSVRDDSWGQLVVLPYKDEKIHKSS